jgi:hypothetical protein
VPLITSSQDKVACVEECLEDSELKSVKDHLPAVVANIILVNDAMHPRLGQLATAGPATLPTVSPLVQVSGTHDFPLLQDNALTFWGFT